MVRGRTTQARTGGESGPAPGRAGSWGPTVTARHPNAWAAEAIRRLREDGAHLLPTPLRALSLPGVPGSGIQSKSA